jgi:hypothetical protein
MRAKDTEQSNIELFREKYKKKCTGFEIIHYLHLVHLHVLQGTKTEYFEGKYHSPPQNFLFHMCVQRGTKLKSKKSELLQI